MWMFVLIDMLHEVKNCEMWYTNVFLCTEINILTGFEEPLQIVEEG